MLIGCVVSPTANDPDALVVKFQTIVRDGKEIIVGRLKVPTVRSLTSFSSRTYLAFAAPPCTARTRIHPQAIRYRCDQRHDHVQGCLPQRDSR